MHQAEVVYIAGYVCPGGTRAGLPCGDIIHRNGMKDVYCARPQEAQKTILDAPMQEIPGEHAFFLPLIRSPFSLTEWLLFLKFSKVS